MASTQALSGCNGRTFQEWLAGAPTPGPVSQRAADFKAVALREGPPNWQDLNADTKTDLYARYKFSEVVHRLVRQQKFDDLDRLADSLRQSKSRFSGGMWKLEEFYSGVTAFSNDKPSDYNWQVRIETLKLWVNQKPDSITARVALADAYSSSAWDARGTDYADNVSQSQWKVFEERLQLAKQTLDDAAKLKVKCPQWYVEMLDVALGQDWSKDQEAAIMEQAIAFEPTYRAYYTHHANFLKPQWHGEEGDWENFAEQTLTQLGPQQGPIEYYRIASAMNCCDYDAEAIYTKARLSWDKIKEGCNTNEQLYGASLEDLNDCARLAGEAEDRPYARQLFQRIGNNWDSVAWPRRESFDRARAWALSSQ